jgi:hypothetical protein
MITSVEGRRPARLAYAKSHRFTERETKAFLNMDRPDAHKIVTARNGGFEARTVAATVRLR